jgi:hypothetical protein
MTYAYRKGSRSDEQFASEIKYRTDMERAAAVSLLNQYVRKAYPDAYLEDHGLVLAVNAMIVTLMQRRWC